MSINTMLNSKTRFLKAGTDEPFKYVFRVRPIKVRAQ